MGSHFALDPGGLDALISSLWNLGYHVVGPTLGDGAIVLGDIRTLADLPAGWTDTQQGGEYRLHRRDDGAFFGFAQGPQSWRKFLSPPRALMWRGTRTKDGFSVEDAEGEGPAERYAFLGARSCDLHALESQDLVYGRGMAEPGYVARRTSAFMMAVNCTEPGGTCFCSSMGTGPRADRGFDLALTEVLGPGQHEFLGEVGSPLGASVLATIDAREVDGTEVETAATLVHAAAGRMGRTMAPEGLRELLATNLEHPRWDSVAERCLSCANCTLVCPTCFCSTVEDVNDVTGDHAERWRSWDSCFTADHSYLHGGSIRPSTRARYRQWLTHKLGTWHDQFGMSGCVGCGRCITWCPVGIDLTEEIAAIRDSQGAP